MQELYHQQYSILYSVLLVAVGTVVVGITTLTLTLLRSALRLQSESAQHIVTQALAPKP